ncbi:hypothetical protein CO054_00495 [Candidatus Shapirobacteria bacterium CG_4_9_14_0_2_um_filter_39_11]|uniref:DUF4446 domain-containing protein n=1 Tax=Candidatus Shapirobacteria bacterium CG_4_9_14_0_2_um_filter_39_11 TaxID=1974478 RepID=A0A2M8ETH8_9BACT|nr:MAG: hypothetical protein CO054_00495 [Candidatus Shapirobacteria bacterium CG_4_9_14_0_2_um_filter_39_11]
MEIYLLGAIFIWLVILSIFIFRIFRRQQNFAQDLGELKTPGQLKIGLVRFNPFPGTGGDQSFCLSILDGEGSGLVISSLHSRETTRIYAKPVKKGKAAGYELSTEEKQAIKNAKKIR